MKTTTYTRKTRQGFTLIELMVVIAILASLAAVAYGPIMRQMKQGDLNQALQNGRQIYTSLTEFRNDMGAFPCDMTAERLKARSADYDFGALTGQFSNDYFRQLFYNHMDSEKNFYCVISGEQGSTIQPDDEMHSGKALQRGECGYAYVMLEEGRAIPLGNTTLPIIMTAVYEAGPGDRVTFDGKSFLGKALVVRLDSSATWETLQESDDVFTLDNLFKKDKKGRDTGSKYVVLGPEL